MMKCGIRIWRLLFVAILVPTFIRADHAEGLRPSLSCLLFGDVGCATKCNLLCNINGCTTWNGYCHGVYCDCHERYAIESRGQDFDRYTDIWDLLAVKFVVTPVFKDIDETLEEYPKIRSEVIYFLKNAKGSGQPLKTKFRQTFPELDDLLRRLRPRLFPEEERNLSKEVQSKQPADTQELSTSRWGSVKNWWNQPQSPEEKKQANQKRIIDLVNGVDNKDDLLTTLQLLKESGDSPLYTGVAKHFLSEGLIMPDGTVILEPMPDPKEVRKALVTDEIFHAINDKIEEEKAIRNTKKKKQNGAQPQESALQTKPTKQLKADDDKKQPDQSEQTPVSNFNYWGIPNWYVSKPRETEVQSGVESSAQQPKKKQSQESNKEDKPSKQNPSDNKKQNEQGEETPVSNFNYWGIPNWYASKPSEPQSEATSAIQPQKKDDKPSKENTNDNQKETSSNKLNYWSLPSWPSFQSSTTGSETKDNEIKPQPKPEKNDTSQTKKKKQPKKPQTETNSTKKTGPDEKQTDPEKETSTNKFNYWGIPSWYSSQPPTTESLPKSKEIQPLSIPNNSPSESEQVFNTADKLGSTNKIPVTSINKPVNNDKMDEIKFVKPEWSNFKWFSSSEESTVSSVETLSPNRNNVDDLFAQDPFFNFSQLQEQPLNQSLPQKNQKELSNEVFSNWNLPDQASFPKNTPPQSETPKPVKNNNIPEVIDLPLEYDSEFVSSEEFGDNRDLNFLFAKLQPEKTLEESGIMSTLPESFSTEEQYELGEYDDDEIDNMLKKLLNTEKVPPIENFMNTAQFEEMNTGTRDLGLNLIDDEMLIDNINNLEIDISPFDTDYLIDRKHLSRLNGLVPLSSESVEIQQPIPKKKKKKKKKIPQESLKPNETHLTESEKLPSLSASQSDELPLSINNLKNNGKKLSKPIPEKLMDDKLKANTPHSNVQKFSLENDTPYYGNPMTKYADENKFTPKISVLSPKEKINGETSEYTSSGQATNPDLKNNEENKIIHPKMKKPPLITDTRVPSKKQSKEAVSPLVNNANNLNPIKNAINNKVPSKKPLHPNYSVAQDEGEVLPSNFIEESGELDKPRQALKPTPIRDTRIPAKKQAQQNVSPVTNNGGDLNLKQKPAKKKVHSEKPISTEYDTGINNDKFEFNVSPISSPKLRKKPKKQNEAENYEQPLQSQKMNLSEKNLPIRDTRVPFKQKSAELTSDNLHPIAINTNNNRDPEMELSDENDTMISNEEQSMPSLLTSPSLKDENKKIKNHTPVDENTKHKPEYITENKKNPKMNDPQITSNETSEEFFSDFFSWEIFSQSTEENNDSGGHPIESSNLSQKLPTISEDSSMPLKTKLTVADNLGYFEKPYTANTISNKSGIPSENTSSSAPIAHFNPKMPATNYKTSPEGVKQLLKPMESVNVPNEEYDMNADIDELFNTSEEDQPPEFSFNPISAHPSSSLNRDKLLPHSSEQNSSNPQPIITPLNQRKSSESISFNSKEFEERLLHPAQDSTKTILPNNKEFPPTAKKKIRKKPLQPKHSTEISVNEEPVLQLPQKMKSAATSPEHLENSSLKPNEPATLSSELSGEDLMDLAAQNSNLNNPSKTGKNLVKKIKPIATSPKLLENLSSGVNELETYSSELLGGDLMDLVAQNPNLSHLLNDNSPLAYSDWLESEDYSEISDRLDSAPISTNDVNVPSLHNTYQNNPTKKGINLPKKIISGPTLPKYLENSLLELDESSIDSSERLGEDLMDLATQNSNPNNPIKTGKKVVKKVKPIATSPKLLENSSLELGEPGIHSSELSEKDFMDFAAQNTNPNNPNKSGKNLPEKIKSNATSPKLLKNSLLELNEPETHLSELSGGDFIDLVAQNPNLSHLLSDNSPLAPSDWLESEDYSEIKDGLDSVQFLTNNANTPSIPNTYQNNPTKNGINPPKKIKSGAISPKYSENSLLEFGEPSTDSSELSEEDFIDLTAQNQKNPIKTGKNIPIKIKDITLPKHSENSLLESNDPGIDSSELSEEDFIDLTAQNQKNPIKTGKNIPVKIKDITLPKHSENSFLESNKPSIDSTELSEQDFIDLTAQKQNPKNPIKIGKNIPVKIKDTTLPKYSENSLLELGEPSTDSSELSEEDFIDLTAQKQNQKNPIKIGKNIPIKIKDTTLPKHSENSLLEPNDPSIDSSELSEEDFIDLTAQNQKNPIKTGKNIPVKIKDITLPKHSENSFLESNEPNIDSSELSEEDFIDLTTQNQNQKNPIKTGKNIPKKIKDTTLPKHSENSLLEPNEPGIDSSELSKEDFIDLTAQNQNPKDPIKTGKNISVKIKDATLPKHSENLSLELNELGPHSSEISEGDFMDLVAQNPNLSHLFSDNSPLAPLNWSESEENSELNEDNLGTSSSQNTNPKIPLESQTKLPQETNKNSLPFNKAKIDNTPTNSLQNIIPTADRNIEPEVLKAKKPNRPQLKPPKMGVPKIKTENKNEPVYSQNPTESIPLKNKSELPISVTDTELDFNKSEKIPENLKKIGEKINNTHNSMDLNQGILDQNSINSYEDASLFEEGPDFQDFFQHFNNNQNENSSNQSDFNLHEFLGIDNANNWDDFLKEAFSDENLMNEEVPEIEGISDFGQFLDTNTDFNPVSDYDYNPDLGSIEEFLTDDDFLIPLDNSSTNIKMEPNQKKFNPENSHNNNPIQYPQMKIQTSPLFDDLDEIIPSYSHITSSEVDKSLNNPLSKNESGYSYDTSNNLENIPSLPSEMLITQKKPNYKIDKTESNYLPNLNESGIPNKFKDEPMTDMLGELLQVDENFFKSMESSSKEDFKIPTAISPTKIMSLSDENVSKKEFDSSSVFSKDEPNLKEMSANNIPKSSSIDQLNTPITKPKSMKNEITNIPKKFTDIPLVSEGEDNENTDFNNSANEIFSDLFDDFTIIKSDELLENISNTPIKDGDKNIKDEQNLADNSWETDINDLFSEESNLWGPLDDFQSIENLSQDGLNEGVLINNAKMKNILDENENSAMNLDLSKSLPSILDETNISANNLPILSKANPQSKISNTFEKLNDISNPNSSIFINSNEPIINYETLPEDVKELLQSTQTFTNSNEYDINDDFDELFNTSEEGQSLEPFNEFVLPQNQSLPNGEKNLQPSPPNNQSKNESSSNIPFKKNLDESLIQSTSLPIIPKIVDELESQSSEEISSNLKLPEIGTKELETPQIGDLSHKKNLLNEPPVNALNPITQLPHHQTVNDEIKQNSPSLYSSENSLPEDIFNLYSVEASPIDLFHGLENETNLFNPKKNSFEDNNIEKLPKNKENFDGDHIFGNSSIDNNSQSDELFNSERPKTFFKKRFGKPSETEKLPSVVPFETDTSSNLEPVKMSLELSDEENDFLLEESNIFDQLKDLGIGLSIENNSGFQEDEDIPYVLNIHTGNKNAVSSKENTFAQFDWFEDAFQNNAAIPKTQSTSSKVTSNDLNPMNIFDSEELKHSREKIDEVFLNSPPVTSSNNDIENDSIYSNDFSLNTSAQSPSKMKPKLLRTPKPNYSNTLQPKSPILSPKFEKLKEKKLLKIPKPQHNNEVDLSDNNFDIFESKIPQITSLNSESIDISSQNEELINGLINDVSPIDETQLKIPEQLLSNVGSKESSELNSSISFEINDDKAPNPDFSSIKIDQPRIHTDEALRLLNSIDTDENDINEPDMSNNKEGIIPSNIQTSKLDQLISSEENSFEFEEFSEQGEINDSASSPTASKKKMNPGSQQPFSVKPKVSDTPLSSEGEFVNGSLEYNPTIQIPSNKNVEDNSINSSMLEDLPYEMTEIISLNNKPNETIGKLLEKLPVEIPLESATIGDTIESSLSNSLPNTTTETPNNNYKNKPTKLLRKIPFKAPLELVTINDTTEPSLLNNSPDIITMPLNNDQKPKPTKLLRKIPFKAPSELVAINDSTEPSLMNNPPDITTMPLNNDQKPKPTKLLRKIPFKAPSELVTPSELDSINDSTEPSSLNNSLDTTTMPLNNDQKPKPTKLLRKIPFKAPSELTTNDGSTMQPVSSTLPNTANPLLNDSPQTQKKFMRKIPPKALSELPINDNLVTPFSSNAEQTLPNNNQKPKPAKFMRKIPPEKLLQLGTNIKNPPIPTEFENDSNVASESQLGSLPDVFNTMLDDLSEENVSESLSTNKTPWKEDISDDNEEFLEDISSIPMQFILDQSPLLQSTHPLAEQDNLELTSDMNTSNSEFSSKESGDLSKNVKIQPTHMNEEPFSDFFKDIDDPDSSPEGMNFLNFSADLDNDLNMTSPLVVNSMVDNFEGPSESRNSSFQTNTSQYLEDEEEHADNDDLSINEYLSDTVNPAAKNNQKPNIRRLNPQQNLRPNSLIDMLKSNDFDKEPQFNFSDESLPEDTSSNPPSSLSSELPSPKPPRFIRKPPPKLPVINKMEEPQTSTKPNKPVLRKMLPPTLNPPGPKPTVHNNGAVNNQLINPANDTEEMFNISVDDFLETKPPSSSTSQFSPLSTKKPNIPNRYQFGTNRKPALNSMPPVQQPESAPKVHPINDSLIKTTPVDNDSNFDDPFAMFDEIDLSLENEVLLNETNNGQFQQNDDSLSINSDEDGSFTDEELRLAQKNPKIRPDILLNAQNQGNTNASTKPPLPKRLIQLRKPPTKD